MQHGGRDSKPGCGPRNLTPNENGQPVPDWYAAKRCTGCFMMGGWHMVGCTATTVIDLAEVEPGVYRAIMEELFTGVAA